MQRGFFLSARTSDRFLYLHSVDMKLRHQKFAQYSNSNTNSIAFSQVLSQTSKAAGCLGGNQSLYFL